MSFHFKPPEEPGIPYDPWFEEDVKAARGIAMAMILSTAFAIAIGLVVFALHRLHS